MLYNLLEQFDGWLDLVGPAALLRVLYQLEFRAFSAVVLSFIFVLMAGRPTIRWLIRQKIRDNPEFHRSDVNDLMRQKRQTPTMGGVLVCGSILVVTLLLADLHNRYVLIALIVMLWLAALGGIDDWLKLTASRRLPGSRHGLYAWEKLLFQLGIGALAGFFIYRHGGTAESAHVLTLPFQRTYIPGLEALVLEPGVIVLGVIPFVVLAMILLTGMSNAVNLADGMDGLVPGSTVITSMGMMALCFIAGSSSAAQYLLFPFVEGAGELMVVSGAMAGACLGFLWFNAQPAQIFMGDTGSLPLGGLLACIAVSIRQEILLLVAGGVFLLEIASVVLQVGWFKYTARRFGEGRRLLRCAPIHHHFHLRGWTEQQVVTRFWILGVVCAALALVLVKLR